MEDAVDLVNPAVQDAIKDELHQQRLHHVDPHIQLLRARVSAAHNATSHRTQRQTFARNSKRIARYGLTMRVMTRLRTPRSRSDTTGLPQRQGG